MKSTIPDKVPFDQHGNLASSLNALYNFRVHKHTGQILTEGIDYAILLPDGTYQPFLDDDTRDAYFESDAILIEPEWKENYVFQATLRRVEYALYGAICFVDEEGHRFPMLTPEYTMLYNKGVIKDKRVTRWWTFLKRGDRYGITWA